MGGRVHFGVFSMSRLARQLGLDIVDQMWIQFRIGSFGFTDAGRILHLKGEVQLGSCLI